MKRRTNGSVLWMAVVGVFLSVNVLLWTDVGVRVGHAQSQHAEHVRWDIISVQFDTPSPGVATINPGGTAFAFARNPPTLSIQLTGSGTFVAPQSGGLTGAVTGGGTWATFSGTTMTGSGTYEVTKLVDWEFATFQPAGNIVHIPGAPANGDAVLRIEYSDGSRGVLGVGCHGPGAPPGILEGVIATKGYVTYWDAAPQPGFTLFTIQ
jgi:hypothetical protein